MTLQEFNEINWHRGNVAKLKNEMQMQADEAFEAEHTPFMKRLPSITKDALGIVPVVEVFVAKGIPLGTALAFMMSVVGLSLPEATMLKKVMTWRLIGIFFGTVAFMIMILGWTFNQIL